TPTTTGADAGAAQNQRTTTTLAGQQKSPHGRPGWEKALLLIAALVVVAGAVIGALTGRRRAAFNRRRAAAATADARTLVAWEEATEALALAGYPPKRAETPAEYATRIPRAAAVSPGPMQFLAEATAAAAYSETGVATEDAAAATEAADEVRHQLAS